MSSTETTTANLEDDMLPDYAGLLKNGVRGKLAGQLTRRAVLAPDVARAYPTDEEVNRVLRRFMERSENKDAAAQTV